MSSTELKECSPNEQLTIQYFFKSEGEELFQDYCSIYAPVASNDVTFFINDISYGSSNLDYGFQVNGQQLVFDTNGVTDYKGNSYGCTIEYYQNEQLLSGKPEDAGDYVVRYVIYYINSNTNINHTIKGFIESFSILPIDGTCSIQMDSFVYGEGASVNPVYSSSTNTGVTPVISYSKNVGGTYTDIPSKPSEAGSYRVTVTYPATTNYKECTSYADFNILARSDEVLFEPLLIDTVLPITSGQPEEEEQYLNLAELSIKDTNLSSVTVNGEEMEFDGSICNLSLSPEGGIKEFEIIVTDLAGNSRRIFFTLIAEWLQDKVVPMEEEISMETEVVYQLPEEGTWTVQGDSTVYPGGTSFCVTESGRYIFNAE